MMNDKVKQVLNTILDRFKSGDLRDFFIGGKNEK